ncbi:MAG: hypothetical protein KatS3mg071_0629 [Meiothermus sp.]|nr:MAG: hypothetical protein KatS3mg071_0629 [Meiothermus sp.]
MLQLPRHLTHHLSYDDGVDYLVAALLVALVFYFLLRVLQGVLPPGWKGRIRSRGMRWLNGSRQRCAVCKELLNPAEVAALRQGRRKCPEMARCPHQRSRWLN